MTIGADGRELITSRDGLSVDADVKCVLNVAVTLAAGGRHTEFVDGRLRIVRRKDGVRTVAICADSSLHGAAFDGAAVNAFLIGHEGLRTYAVRLHEELLSVAAAACGRDMGVIDRGIRVAASQYRVCVSVAVKTIRRHFAGGRAPCMHAVFIGTGCTGVATDAENLLRRSLMHEALYVLVAIDAGKLHGTVDRVLKLLAIHEQRNRLTVDVLGQRCLAVASQAVLVFELVLGANGEGRAQQRQRERTEQDPAGNLHDYEETPDAVVSP